jgi:sialic acid synthase SpsE
MTPVHFGDRPVGGNAPPLLLPDIDLFFNQDLAVAEDMVTRLIEAGVEFVKGAVLQHEGLALNDDTTVTYFDRERMVEERYRDLIARKVVSLEATERLFDMVRQAGCGFLLSVYDIEGASFAKDIGSAAIKIPSSNITHEPLIRYAGGLRLPIIIDTGKSTLEEIARAENWARDAGATGLVLEHSPMAPPAPLAEHHLRMIPTLAATFRVPVGLSDHHRGNEMMLAATALGAAVLEKGVCPDGAAVDQDVYHAMQVSEIGEVLKACAMIHEALGDPMRRLRRDREKPRDRMGLIAKTDLDVGDILSGETIDFAFPCRGIDVEHWSVVEGWRVRTPLNKGAVVDWHHVEAVAP